jgi:exonuclease I
MTEQELKWRIRAFFRRQSAEPKDVDLKLVEKLLYALEAREEFIAVADEECKRWMVYFHEAVRERGAKDFEEAVKKGIWALLYAWASEDIEVTE